MLELAAHGPDMLAVALYAAAILSGRLDFRRHIPEDVQVAELQLHRPGEISQQLIDADLRDVRPDAKRIGKMHDSNGFHPALL